MFVTQYFVGKSCPCESESVVHSDYLRLFRILAIVDPGVTRFRILLDTFFGIGSAGFQAASQSLLSVGDTGRCLVTVDDILIRC